MDLDRIDRIASLIRIARESALLADLPADLVPRDEQEAYGIQDALAAPEEVIGWKVAPVASGASYRCAPIVASARIEAGGVFDAGLMAPEIEAEVALVLGADFVPGDGAFSADTVGRAVAGAALCIEVLGSCFRDRKAVSDLSSLADRQSNFGLVTGPMRPDWQGLEFSAVRPIMTTTDRGAPIASDKTPASTSDILAALAWLAGHASGRGRHLRAGHIIITGARVGPVPIAAGEGVTASCAELESVFTRRC